MFGIVAEGPEVVRAAVETVSAHGPHEMRTWSAEYYGLAVGLLAGSSEHGAEPLLCWDDATATCGLMDGRVFELDADEQGRAAENQDAGGACTLLRLWERLGPDVVCHTAGLFAAAVWEARRQRLTLLRDWAGGIHDVFYARTDGGLAFASSITDLLRVGAHDGNVDERALAQYLDFGHILPPHTLFAAIRKLPPGCALTYADGDVRVERVFRLRLSSAHSDDLVESFRAAHREAVARCISDRREVGAFLSGGLDSSFNVAVMSELTEQPVKTFSISYPGSELDESRYARLVAERFGTEHHELALDSARVLDELPQMIRALGEPAMDYSFVPTFCLARLAREHVAIAISGDGPDHLLGRHYPVAAVRRELGRLPGMRALASALLPGGSGGGGGGSWRRLRRRDAGRMAWKALQSLAGDELQAYLGIYREIAYRGLLPQRRGAILADDAPRTMLQEASVDPLVTDVLDGDADDLARMIALDLAIDGAFGVFAKVGRMAAYHGLGVCEPYLDLQVTSLLQRIPSQMRVRGSRADLLRGNARTKYVLYQAARGVVPDEVLSKPKQGFQAPIGDWLCEWIEGRDAGRLLPALTGEIGLLDAPAVTRILREHLAGEYNHETLIMMLITLDLWYAIFVLDDGEMPTWSWREWLEQH